LKLQIGRVNSKLRQPVIIGFNINRWPGYYNAIKNVGGSFHFLNLFGYLLGKPFQFFNIIPKYFY